MKVKLVLGLWMVALAFGFRAQAGPVYEPDSFAFPSYDGSLLADSGKGFSLYSCDTANVVLKPTGSLAAQLKTLASKGAFVHVEGTGPRNAFVPTSVTEISLSDAAVYHYTCGLGPRGFVVHGLLNIDADGQPQVEVDQQPWQIKYYFSHSQELLSRLKASTPIPVVTEGVYIPEGYFLLNIAPE